MNICVKVELSKEMPKSMNFTFQGKDTLVEYTYPCLPPKCTACGKWGHYAIACHRVKENDEENEGLKLEHLKQIRMRR